MSVLNCCIVFISDKRADGADAMVLPSLPGPSTLLFSRGRIMTRIDSNLAPGGWQVHHCMSHVAWVQHATVRCML